MFHPILLKFLMYLLHILYRNHLRLISFYYNIILNTFHLLFLQNSIRIHSSLLPVNYDIVATMAEGSAVRRIKKGVNEVNGHIWDKVLLSNGKIGYIFADKVEIVIFIPTVSFKLLCISIINILV